MIEIDHIGTAVFVVAPRRDGSFVYRDSNAGIARMTGLGRAAIVGHTPEQVFGPDVAAVVVSNYRDCIARRTTVEFERTVHVPLGSIVMRTTLTPVFGAGGKVRRVLGVVIDVTEQHRLREDLRRSQVRLAIAVDALGAAHWFYDKDKQVFEFSPAFARISGIKDASRIGMEAWLTHVHPADREDTCFIDILAERIQQGTAEFRVFSDAGEERWLRCRRGAVAEHGVLTGIAGIIVDITQEKRREAALSLQATSDALTGLPNRRALDETLSRATSHPVERGEALSLLMIDVDHFKAYNDRYGHVAGDHVLQRLARRFSAAAQQVGGTAARFGGEEFAAVLPRLTPEQAARVAADILARVQAMNEPHGGSPLGRLSVSIGVAGEAAGRRSGADLVALADAALYAAKRAGRDCYRLAGPAAAATAAA